MAVRFVPSLFVTERFTTVIAPSTMLALPFCVKVLKAMLWPVFVRTAPLFTVKVAVAATDELTETVPPIVRLWNIWPDARLIVCEVPVKVTVDVPEFRTEPAPVLSQEPLTVQVPARVIVPETAPVIVTLVNVDVEVPAARVPPSGTKRFEPPVMLNPPVVSVPLTVKKLDTSMAVDWVTVPETVRL